MAWLRATFSLESYSLSRLSLTNGKVGEIISALVPVAVCGNFEPSLKPEPITERLALRGPASTLGVRKCIGGVTTERFMDDGISV